MKTFKAKDLINKLPVPTGGGPILDLVRSSVGDLELGLPTPPMPSVVAKAALDALDGWEVDLEVTTKLVLRRPGGERVGAIGGRGVTVFKLGAPAPQIGLPVPIVEIGEAKS